MLQKIIIIVTQYLSNPLFGKRVTKLITKRMIRESEEMM